jgi:hypothetical protein
MIDKNLTLLHRNGQVVYPDGTTIMPSGKIHTGSKQPTVGIIYRPGLSPIRGVQTWAIEEPPIDRAVFESIVPADPTKGISKRLTCRYLYL